MRHTRSRPGGSTTSAELYESLAAHGHSDLFDDYLHFHAGRIVYLLDLLEPIVDAAAAMRPGPVRLLDVGPAHLTAALHARFGSRVRISTLGWGDERVEGAPWIERHFQYDLNDAQEPARWVAPEPHDVVVLAEVLEHLYTSPVLVLRFLATFLGPGGTLVIQTPNAVSVRKRVKMVLGRHPYEMIRVTREDPGHFREYTATELESAVREASLHVDALHFESYWRRQLDHGSSATGGGRLRGAVATALDGGVRLVERARPSFRQGLTVVARRGAAGAAPSQPPVAS